MFMGNSSRTSRLVWAWNKCIFDLLVLKEDEFQQEKSSVCSCPNGSSIEVIICQWCLCLWCQFLDFHWWNWLWLQKHLRKYGYGLRGHPIRCRKLLVRGERISLITAMTVKGILDVQECVTGDVFYNFVQKRLLPHVMPFNGFNSNSVVVTDNCSVHHVNGVTSLIQEVGTLVHFLPPYSPDFTPIELLFSKLKHLVRAMELEMDTTGDIETIVLAALACISADDCRQWIYSISLYIWIICWKTLFFSNNS